MSQKKRKDPKMNANRFLAFILAAIFVFVGAICLASALNNKKIKPSKKAETSSAEAAKKADDETKAENISETAPSESTEPKEETTAETETEQTTESTTAETESATHTPPADAPSYIRDIGTFDDPKIIPGSTLDGEQWNLLLINSCYRLPEDYTPELTYVCNSDQRLDSRVAPYYEKMYDAAAKDGIYLTPCSGYRSYERQERNYKNKTTYYKNQGLSEHDALVKAATVIMPPGSSEHNLGIAMDIVNVLDSFANTAEYKWLEKNAADYGFILRYPKDKTDITKVVYEPWHWRYVGTELAKELKASGLTLEEYFGVTQN